MMTMVAIATRVGRQVGRRAGGRRTATHRSATSISPLRSRPEALIPDCGRRSLARSSRGCGTLPCARGRPRPYFAALRFLSPHPKHDPMWARERESREEQRNMMATRKWKKAVVRGCPPANRGNFFHFRDEGTWTICVGPSPSVPLPPLPRPGRPAFCRRRPQSKPDLISRTRSDLGWRDARSRDCGESGTEGVVGRWREREGAELYCRFPFFPSFPSSL